MDLVTENNIYDNYSHTSCVDWEIKKTTEAYPKKLEFNIDKLETGMKQIDSNINVNDNEIDDIYDKEALHPSDNLADDKCSNIEDHENQHKGTNRNNSIYTLFEYKLQSSPYLEDPNEAYD